jgi:hypothetical protein
MYYTGREPLVVLLEALSKDHDVRACTTRAKRATSISPQVTGDQRGTKTGISAWGEYLKKRRESAGILIKERRRTK